MHKTEPEVRIENHLAAKLFFSNSPEAIANDYSSTSLGYGLTLAVLVNCCTMVKNTIEGQSLAFRALDARNNSLACRYDTLCVKYALARSFINEMGLDMHHVNDLRRMAEAKKLFRELLETVSSTDYLAVLIRIDLNWVMRKFNEAEGYALDQSSVLWKALDHLTFANYDMQVRFLEELYHVNYRQMTDAVKYLNHRRPILEATKEKLGRNWRLRTEGRLEVFEGRCNDLETLFKILKRLDRDPVPIGQQNML